MTQQFHPTTWIDQQRNAGMARGNVFADILAAAKSIRQGYTQHADYRAERRVAQVHEIKRQAAAHDRACDPRNPAHAPSFPELVERWKGLR
jgi:hypothetical protein